MIFINQARLGNWLTMRKKNEKRVYGNVDAVCLRVSVETKWVRGRGDLGAVASSLGYRLYWLALTILYAHWPKSLIMARACKEIVLNYGCTRGMDKYMGGWMDRQTMDRWMNDRWTMNGCIVGFTHRSIMARWLTPSPFAICSRILL